MSVIAISGLGNATGTGAAVARLFASLGYHTALISRPRKEVDDLASEINKDGKGQAKIFSVDKYSHVEIKGVFEGIRQTWPEARLRAAVWNTAQWSNIPFLDITEADIRLSAELNIIAATAFSQEAIRAFIAPSSSGPEGDVGGTLILTGATSALRGKEAFGAFAAGKHGLRALSQSIAREYGPQGVHSAFVVIDGTILTTRTAKIFADRPGKDANWLHDEKQRLAPESIARCYLYLHQQSPDAWTLEMDLRPCKEKF
ncbi:hypothetical protein JCM6882_001013 [Rhodosporidiobolus microsporus]